MNTNFEICMAVRAKHGNGYIYGIADEPQNAIRKVIFSNPATIVIWADGTKTVVKAGERTVFDPEKGLAMAISKKFLGNQGNYYKAFRKHLEEAEAGDITKDYMKLLDDLNHDETDLYNCRLYLDKIFELDPSMYDRLMEEYSGMPGYVYSKSTTGE